MKDSFKSIVDGFKKKLTGELKNSISKMKGSYFDDPKGGNGEAVVNQSKVGTDIDQLLSRKVDIQDFHDQLSTKPDKNEFIILHEQIDLIHTYMKSLAQVVH